MTNYKPDWSKAPHDAQFFSCGAFRKNEGGKGYLWHKTEWRKVNYWPLDEHKSFPDFELRPETVNTDWNGIKYQSDHREWQLTITTPIYWNIKQSGFEIRPESVQSDAVQNEKKYTHYTSARNGEIHVYTKCVIVSPTKDKHGNIVVLNEFGFYKTVPQSELQPIRTKRDKWVDAALSTVSNTDNGHLRYFAESIYDTLKSGDLKAPE